MLYVGISRVRNGDDLRIFPSTLASTDTSYSYLRKLKFDEDLIGGIDSFRGENGEWVTPRFPKLDPKKKETGSAKKRPAPNSAASPARSRRKVGALSTATGFTYPSPAAKKVAAAKQPAASMAKASEAKRKLDFSELVKPTAGQAKSKDSVTTQSVATAAALGNQIYLCDGDGDDEYDDYEDDNDDDNDDGADDIGFSLCEEDYVDIDDDDKMAGIVGSLGSKQDHEANDTPEARVAREARDVLIQANKTRWQTRIDGSIAAARDTLAALGEHGLLDFNRHHLRPSDKKLTQQQVNKFWTLPGVAQSLGHLRYTPGGPDELVGTFDTGKWNDPINLLQNTCPYDSPIEEAHRMLCADADLLLLLQQQAGNEQASIIERDAAHIILDMHRFASARMWDAARLVVVRHALFVGNVYDQFVPSAFRSETVLDLSASVNYVDRLFAAAGASIGGFEQLVRKASCDNEGCELNQPLMENLVDSGIVFEVSGPPSFEDRLTRWFALPKECCRKTIGSVCTGNSSVLHVKYSINLMTCSF
jgi:hypothetical protein